MKIMAKPSLYSEERISFQDPTKFNRFVEAFKRLRDELMACGSSPRAQDKAAENSGVAKLVKDTFGVTIDFDVQSHRGNEPKYNAYMIPPQMHKNHVLINSSNRQYHSLSQLEKVASRNESLTADIDLDKAVIKGKLADVVIPVRVTAEFLTTSAFTPEETTAVFLHEIGHAFYWFVYLGRLFFTNHVLEALSLEYNQNDDRRYRVELINKASELLGLDNRELEEFYDIKDARVVRRALATRSVMTRFSLTDTPVYDSTTYEALSDMFVSRLGGATHLSSALSKIYDLYGYDVTKSRTTVMLARLFQTIIFLPFIILLLPLLILGALTNGTSEPSYDHPVDRIRRIRQDLVKHLKESKNQQDAKLIIQDINTVDDALSKLTKHPEFWLDALLINLNSKELAQRKRTAVMQELENLTTNELFVKAAILKHLS